MATGARLLGKVGLPWPLHQGLGTGIAEAIQDHHQGEKTENHQPEPG